MFSTPNKDATIWMNVSDLFSVLFLVFLVLSMLFVSDSMEVIEKVEQAEQEQEAVKKDIKDELKQEFSKKMEEWQAEFIDSTLSIRFYSSSGKILFKRGSAELQPYYKQVLGEFFPAYLDILYRDSIRYHIQDIRIEGHTSPEGDYFSNMLLSQQRANSVLQLLLSEETSIVGAQRAWFLQLVSSNGLGAKNKIPYKKYPKFVNARKSRRVEIKLVLRDAI